MGFKHIVKRYGVPACYGRAIVHGGRAGVIVREGGDYLVVNFDKDKPDAESLIHPEDGVEYGGLRPVRPRNLYREEPDLYFSVTCATCAHRYDEADKAEVPYCHGCTHYAR